MKKKWHILFALIFSSYGCYQSHGNDLDSSVEVIFDTSFIDHAGCFRPVCDIIVQCGCPDGFMCTLVFSTPGPVRACVPVGERQSGEACSFFECAPGSICLDGVCRVACHENADCPSTDECVHDLEGEDLRACSLPCSPMDGENCLEGWKCVAHQSTGSEVKFFSDCEISTGDVEFFGECSVSSDCIQGFGCASNTCGLMFCTNLCQEDPLCPSSMPICGSDDFLGTINGIAYSFCAGWYDTECDY
jgi:hypothetical protein